MKSPKSKSQVDDQQYGERETAQRRDEWLRRSLNTPPKPHSQVVAERKAKRAAKSEKVDKGG
jgi:hypothetical protein